ncbi:MAG TPA: O-antigen ligase family protein [Nocardioidaceae bacterium]|jgi:O-antigen ligase|nr:O-antigen ligase family protein [Nocardioidaceae bacterium]
MTSAETVDLTHTGRPRHVHRDEALPVMVGATVALLPILVPAGPGNTAIADAGIAGCLLVAVLWVSREHLPIAFPYGAGVTLLLIGGALAATVSGAPLSTALVLAQDVFLLLWAATLALGRYDPAILAAATVTWCRVAVVYSAVVIVAYIIGFSPLSGVTAKDGVRASYTFGDPNLAGNYLVMSLFMMVACKRPRATSTRRLGYALVLLAMGFTGSNGAMLTLLVGLVISVALSRYRHRGVLAGLLSMAIAAAVAALVMVFALPQVDFDAVRAQAANSVPLLRDSFGRSGSSASERKTILQEGTHLFLQGNAIGVGPARTKQTFEATQAPYVKEAHNDYLATLLERGLIGALGLAVLAAAVGGRCWRLLNGELSPAMREVVPRFYLLVVLAPVVAVAAGFYEVLHFRHVWTWLGIVAALTLSMQDHGERRS